MNAFTILYKTDKTAFNKLRRAYQKRIWHFPLKLEAISQDELDEAQGDVPRGNPPLKVWRSRFFLVQLFNQDGHLRLSINRTKINNEGNWCDGITWDELMACKHACGFGDRWAVEVFPPEQHVVNVANIRHLWLVDQPSYAWINQ
jgi:hypothetical protein